MLCQELFCQITNVPGAGSVSINIDVILDERFYYVSLLHFCQLHMHVLELYMLAHAHLHTQT